MTEKKGSLTEEFVHQIELKILSGEWKTGTKIPTLRDLAADMGMSRSVINAGIVELINKGYLKTVPRKWTEVADWKREGTLAVLNGLMENRIRDAEVLTSLLDSRMVIETRSAYLAALNRSEKDLMKLKAITDKEKTINDINAAVENDLAFHHMVAVASGNLVYPLILKSFENSTYTLIKEFYSTEGVQEFVYGRHYNIYKAIENQDAEGARKLMSELLLHGENIINGQGR
jgi:DNA-binding FadR family transcriptional regulator